jgi:protein-tyrosine phosphatase
MRRERVLSIIHFMSSWFRSYGFADVQDKLVVGAYPLDREDVGMLEWMKIERILNLVEDKEYSSGEREEVEDALAAAGIEEHRVSLTDYGRLPADKLEHAVEEVIDWIDQGHRVYVHCRAGWQRSAAVVAGVVAVTEGIEIEDALEFVRRRKPSADPLPQQREDLLLWWAERDHAPVVEAPTHHAVKALDELVAPEAPDHPAELDHDSLDDEAKDLLSWLAELDPARRPESADDLGGEPEG